MTTYFTINIIGLVVQIISIFTCAYGGYSGSVIMFILSIIIFVISEVVYCYTDRKIKDIFYYYSVSHSILFRSQMK